VASIGRLNLVEGVGREPARAGSKTGLEEKQLPNFFGKENEQ
jgi:hypothetical protein